MIKDIIALTMIVLITLVIIISISGCHTGDLGEECNKNGTCNSPNLECLSDISSPHCWIKREKTECNDPADCFCKRCLEKCSGAFKRCEYTDTSVWGSKPTVCECK